MLARVDPAAHCSAPLAQSLPYDAGIEKTHRGQMTPNGTIPVYYVVQGKGCVSSRQCVTDSYTQVGQPRGTDLA